MTGQTDNIGSLIDVIKQINKLAEEVNKVNLHTSNTNMVLNIIESVNKLHDIKINFNGVNTLSMAVDIMRLMTSQLQGVQDITINVDKIQNISDVISNLKTIISSLAELSNNVTNPEEIFKPINDVIDMFNNLNGIHTENINGLIVGVNSIKKIIRKINGIQKLGNKISVNLVQSAFANIKSCIDIVVNYINELGNIKLNEGDVKNFEYNIWHVAKTLIWTITPILLIVGLIGPWVIGLKMIMTTLELSFISGGIFGIQEKLLLHSMSYTVTMISYLLTNVNYISHQILMSLPAIAILSTLYPFIIKGYEKYADIIIGIKGELNRAFGHQYVIPKTKEEAILLFLSWQTLYRIMLEKQRYILESVKIARSIALNIMITKIFINKLAKNKDDILKLFEEYAKVIIGIKSALTKAFGKQLFESKSDKIFTVINDAIVNYIAPPKDSPADTINKAIGMVRSVTLSILTLLPLLAVLSKLKNYITEKYEDFGELMLNINGAINIVFGSDIQFTSNENEKWYKRLQLQIKTGIWAEFAKYQLVASILDKSTIIVFDAIKNTSKNIFNTTIQLAKVTLVKKLIFKGLKDFSDILGELITMIDIDDKIGDLLKYSTKWIVNWSILYITLSTQLFVIRNISIGILSLVSSLVKLIVTKKLIIRGLDDFSEIIVKIDSILQNIKPKNTTDYLSFVVAIMSLNITAIAINQLIDNLIKFRVNWTIFNILSKGIGKTLFKVEKITDILSSLADHISQKGNIKTLFKAEILILSYIGILISLDKMIHVLKVLKKRWKLVGILSIKGDQGAQTGMMKTIDYVNEIIDRLGELVEDISRKNKRNILETLAVIDSFMLLLTMIKSIVIQLVMITPILLLFTLAAPIILISLLLFKLLMKVVIKIFNFSTREAVQLIRSLYAMGALLLVIIALDLIVAALLVLALLSIGIAANFMNILKTLLIVTAVVVAIAIMGFVLYMAQPLIISFLVSVGSLFLAISAILGITLALHFLEKIELNLDLIIGNVKKVMTAVRTIISALYSNDIENESPEDYSNNPLGSLFGSVVTRILSYMAYNTLISALIAVACVLGMALMLSVVQRIDLNGRKIQQNVSLILGLVGMINSGMNTIMSPAGTPPSSNLASILQQIPFVGELYTTFVSLLSVPAFLSAVIDVACIWLIATMLKFIQNIKLNRRSIIKNVEIICDLIHDINNRLNGFNGDTMDQPTGFWDSLSKAGAGIVTSLGVGISSIFNSIAALFNVVTVLATLITVGCIWLIAKMLMSIGDMKFNAASIKQRVGEILGICNYLQDMIIGGAWANAGEKSIQESTNGTYKDAADIQLLMSLGGIITSVGKLIEVIVNIATVLTILITVGCIWLIAKMLMSIGDMKFNKQAIQDKVKDILGICNYLQDMIIGGAWANANENSNENTDSAWLEAGKSILLNIGGAVLSAVKLLEVLVNSASVILTLISVGCIWLIAKMLLSIQDIQISPKVLHDKLDTIFGSCNMLLDWATGNGSYKQGEQYDEYKNSIINGGTENNPLISGITSILGNVGSIITGAFQFIKIIMANINLLAIMISVGITWLIANMLNSIYKMEFRPNELKEKLFAIMSGCELILDFAIFGGTFQKTSDKINGSPLIDAAKAANGQTNGGDISWFTSVAQFIGNAFAPMLGIIHFMKIMSSIINLAALIFAVSLVRVISRMFEDIMKLDINISGLQNTLAGIMNGCNIILDWASGKTNNNETQNQIAAGLSSNSTTDDGIGGWIANMIGAPIRGFLRLWNIISAVIKLRAVYMVIAIVANIAKSLKIIQDLKIVDTNTLRTKVISLFKLTDVISQAMSNSTGIFDSIKVWIKGSVKNASLTNLNSILISLTQIAGSMLALMENINKLGINYYTRKRILQNILSFFDVCDGIQAKYKIAEKWDVNDANIAMGKFNQLLKGVLSVADSYYEANGLSWATIKAGASKFRFYITDMDDLLSNINKNLVSKYLNINNMVNILNKMRDIPGSLNDIFTQYVSQELPEQKILTAAFDKCIYGIDQSDKIIQQITKINVNRQLLVNKLRAINDIQNQLQKFTHVTDTDVKNNKALTDNYIKFINRLDRADFNKLKVMERTMAHWASLAHAINGNFEGLAKSLNEHIAPMLEKMNTTMDNVKQVQEKIMQDLTQNTMNDFQATGGSIGGMDTGTSGGSVTTPSTGSDSGASAVPSTGSGTSTASTQSAAGSRGMTSSFNMDSNNGNRGDSKSKPLYVKIVK